MHQPFWMPTGSECEKHISLMKANLRNRYSFKLVLFVTERDCCSLFIMATNSKRWYLMLSSRSPEDTAECDTRQIALLTLTIDGEQANKISAKTFRHEESAKLHSSECRKRYSKLILSDHVSNYNPHELSKSSTHSCCSSKALGEMSTQFQSDTWIGLRCSNSWRRVGLCNSSMMDTSRTTSVMCNGWSSSRNQSTSSDAEMIREDSDGAI
jgi:hypothetical protein